MTDYSDYKVWKEVELTPRKVSLSEYKDYTPEIILEITTRLVELAKEQCLEGCYLMFKSNYEPHEDYLGPASVTPCGYRKVTYAEVESRKREERVTVKANELGITFHEANTLMSLQERGVI